jgi:hypothetical protein
MTENWRDESWATAYVHYYAPDKTGLLLDAVRPLFDWLRPEVPRAYFVRHWRFGPHLRLRFPVDRDTFGSTIRPEIDDIVGGYLRAHPSTVAIDEAELLRQHRRLAKLESERGELTPYRPDNTIRYESAGPLGSDEEDEIIQRTLAAFYADSTPLAFAMLDALREGRTTRYDLAVDMMVSVAHAMYTSPRNPSITEGFVSFRSHAEAYIAMVPERDAVRAHFDAQYRRFAPALTRRVRDIVATLDAGHAPTPFIREWLDLAGPHAANARGMVASGDLILPFPHHEATGKIGWDDEWVDHSRFHTLINESDAYLDLLFKTLWFQQYRMALNLMYLHLNRLGVMPVERYLLCHLVAGAVEEVFGISAMGLARQFAESARA